MTIISLKDWSSICHHGISTSGTCKECFTHGAPRSHKVLGPNDVNLQFDTEESA